MTLSPPTLADAHNTLAARLLNGITLSVAATALVGAVLIPLTAPAQLWALYFVIVSLIFLVCLVAFWLLRRGTTQLASWLLLGIIWLGITVTAATSGGVQSTAYIGYIGAIMLTGLLLGGPASTSITVLSILAGFGMAAGVSNGWLPPLEARTPVQSWAVSSMLLAVCALIQQFASGSMAMLLKRASDSEASYRMLFEAAPDGILIADAGNRLSLVNPAACRMLGYSAQELAGKYLADLIAPEDLDRHPWDAPEALRASGRRSHERLAVNKSGARVPVILGSGYMPDGRFQYLLQDVTELKQTEAARLRAEDARRESETVYRRAIEAAGAVPYYLDYSNDQYIFIGDRMTDLTGYPTNEITPDLMGNIEQEYQLMGEADGLTKDEAVRRARAGQIHIWKSDSRIRTRSGDFRWISDSSIQLRDEAGTVVGAIGIVQDITERKAALEEVRRLNAELEQRVADRTEALRASEAQFRATNDASPLGIFIDDPNGDCVYTNAVYQNITGLSAEQMLGSGWLSAVHPSDRDAVASKGEAARRRAPFRYELVYRMRRRDGRVVWVSVKASAMHDGDTRLGYVGTVEDITARIEAEESLRRRTAQLEAANKELEAFSYSISHDLRAPLRAMDGFSRLLVERYGQTLEPEAVRYLHKVRDNAQQMGRLIDDLLAFSRLGRHSLRLQYISSTDLAALARKVADEACAEAPDRRFKVFVGDLPPCEADFNLLTQVFVNLLTNAVKFTRPRTVAEIEIGSLSADDGPAYFVRDNGVGFDMEYAHKVFGVFQRLHRMEDFEGTGVGLAIVQRIIHRHGGRIWVEAVPDKGATFCFTIGKAPVTGD